MFLSKTFLAKMFMTDQWLAIFHGHNKTTADKFRGKCHPTLVHSLESVPNKCIGTHNNRTHLVKLLIKINIIKYMWPRYIAHNHILNMMVVIQTNFVFNNILI